MNEDSIQGDANFISPRHELHKKIYKKQQSRYKLQKKKSVRRLTAAAAVYPSPEQQFVQSILNHEFEPSDEDSHSSYERVTEREQHEATLSNAGSSQVENEEARGSIQQIHQEPRIIEPQKDVESLREPQFTT